MGDIPNNDKPGFVAEKPEHCFACYRLIRPGQIYHPIIGLAMLCSIHFEAADPMRVTDDLVVVVEDGRLLVRRVSVYPEAGAGATFCSECAARPANHRFRER